MDIIIKKMESIPPDSNPFDHDSFHMGNTIGKDLLMMYATHKDEELKYFILVDQKTGERVRINISK